MPVLLARIPSVHLRWNYVYDSGSDRSYAAAYFWFLLSPRFSNPDNRNVCNAVHAGSCEWWLLCVFIRKRLCKHVRNSSVQFQRKYRLSSRLLP